MLLFKCWHLLEIVSGLPAYSNVRPEVNQISRLHFCACANSPILYCCKNEENRCTQSCYIAKFPLLCIWCTVWKIEGITAARQPVCCHLWLLRARDLKYSAIFTKSQKFILRRSWKNYTLLKGKLYYKEQIQNGTERDRLVVNRSEADRVFLECTNENKDFIH